MIIDNDIIHDNRSSLICQKKAVKFYNPAPAVFSFAPLPILSEFSKLEDEAI